MSLATTVQSNDALLQHHRTARSDAGATVASPRSPSTLAASPEYRMGISRSALGGTPPAADHPCFATRLGGTSGDKESQGCLDSSQTAIVGAGKFGSAKLPIAMATYPGKPSPSQ
jgi:hypothetical protein